jgi:Dolichyl-phosphate-mannose-protein mannosyltransferase
MIPPGVPPYPQGTRRLLQASDLAPLFGLMAAGATLRLLYWSGYGLGDDIIFRGDLATILLNKVVPMNQNGYRFTWWFPTAISCRLLGLGEIGLTAPVTLFSTLGIGAAYLLGKASWGRPGGVIAGLLLAVYPLDFAWATMITPDVFVSLFSALTVLFVQRALVQETWWAKRRLWALAAFALWLAFHAKISAALLSPALVMIAWGERRRLDRQCLAFIGVAALLFGLTVGWSYAVGGDPIAPYHLELSAQGLTPVNAHEHRLNSFLLLYYPRSIFLPDHLGDLLHSVFPHLIVLFALASPWLGLRTSLPAFWWLLFVFLGMEFNTQHIGDMWVAGFRNFRHSHVFVHPIALLLTGYLVTFRARFRRTAHALIAVLVAFSLWQCAAAAMKTQSAFADRRQAITLLAKLPRKTIYSDFQIGTWVPALNPDPPLTTKTLHAYDTNARRLEIARIHSGYLITGGAREPYYGCIDCIPRAAELAPGSWRLLLEIPGIPPTFWRPEPLRVWEAIEEGPPTGGG